MDVTHLQVNIMKTFELTASCRYIPMSHWDSGLLLEACFSGFFKKLASFFSVGSPNNFNMLCICARREIIWKMATWDGKF